VEKIFQLVGNEKGKISRREWAWNKRRAEDGKGGEGDKEKVRVSKSRPF